MTNKKSFILFTLLSLITHQTTNVDRVPSHIAKQKRPQDFTNFINQKISEFDEKLITAGEFVRRIQSKYDDTNIDSEKIKAKTKNNFHNFAKAVGKILEKFEDEDDQRLSKMMVVVDKIKEQRSR